MRTTDRLMLDLGTDLAILWIRDLHRLLPQNLHFWFKFPTLRFKNLHPPYCNTGVSEKKLPTNTTLSTSFRDRVTFPVACPNPDFATFPARTMDFCPAEPLFCDGDQCSMLRFGKYQPVLVTRVNAEQSSQSAVGVRKRKAPQLGCYLWRDRTSCANSSSIGGQYDQHIHYAQ